MQTLVEGYGQQRMCLHSTIRFSIDDSVNILTPCFENYTYKIYQTGLILEYHPCRLVSMNNNYMFLSSIPHYIPLN